MIQTLHLSRFGRFSDQRVELGPFNVLVGPNGCGKTTVLNALRFVLDDPSFTATREMEKSGSGGAGFSASVTLGEPFLGAEIRATFDGKDGRILRHFWQPGIQVPPLKRAVPSDVRSATQASFYSLEPPLMKKPTPLNPNVRLISSGSNLAAALASIRDRSPEDWQRLQQELQAWFPEYNAVLFDVPQQGHYAIRLRTTNGASVPAETIGDGALIALGLLCIAWQPDPPAILCMEEPERGLHPRLLKRVAELLHRIAGLGESETPSRGIPQIVLTTHSPFLLDHFKEDPSEVIIVEPEPDGAKFTQLGAHPLCDDIRASNTALGDLWFSGVLGGVPANI